MIIEADAADDPTHDFKSFSIGVDVEHITNDQINKFNQEMSSCNLWLVHKSDAGTFTKESYLWLVKVDPNEDPDENFGPFDSQYEAIWCLDIVLEFFKIKRQSKMIKER